MDRIPPRVSYMVSIGNHEQDHVMVEIKIQEGFNPLDGI